MRRAWARVRRVWDEIVWTVHMSAPKRQTDEQLEDGYTW